MDELPLGQQADDPIEGAGSELVGAATFLCNCVLSRSMRR
ncbi:ATP-dependent DNA helicase HelY domain protein [Mycobacterium kansasii 662]|uniref:ATP-dependent DNA helicase HelY domain protein n=1 Tax=Mycobacterium kansasii 662 TaxID=1299326 RepID=X7XRE4_MYCKA|nr:ATP-dependent DNA helicase HelY domain protein [Mycobacterium kansasii 662]